MAEKKEPLHKKLYKDSPKMERDEKSGSMKASKKSEKAEAPLPADAGSEGGEAIPMPARHAMERHTMHARHEIEHSAHDHGGHGDKKIVHERHEKEMKEMHARHEKDGVGEKGIEHVDKKKEPEGGDKKPEEKKVVEK